MSWETILAESIRSAIPAALCLLMAWIVFRSMHRQAELKDLRRLRLKAFATYVPMKIAAHERIILFLTRTEIIPLIQRCDPNNKPVELFRAQLVEEIKAEFQHNIVQQLYVSAKSWGLVTSAKEQIISFINQGSASLPPESPAIELAKILITSAPELEPSLIQQAVVSLKQDVSELFNY